MHIIRHTPLHSLPHHYKYHTQHPTLHHITTLQTSYHHNTNTTPHHHSTTSDNTTTPNHHTTPPHHTKNTTTPHHKHYPTTPHHHILLQRPPFSLDIFSIAEGSMLMDFAMQNYFKHFKLYKYVFTPNVI